ncbi:hypothetical protein [Nocardia noduli]|uniref:hypothetical protein n=1 Tax=Nocardia noduli TaxID=2815722 RepID=UPI001C24BA98|nr:hypothetical protein [Nocardia noduli]
MKKLSMFVLTGAAAAGIVLSGAGMAAADEGTTPPPAAGTGSSEQLAKVLQGLSSGSSKPGQTPAPTE